MPALDVLLVPFRGGSWGRPREITLKLAVLMKRLEELSRQKVVLVVQSV